MRVGFPVMSSHVFFYSSFPLPLASLWHQPCKETALHHLQTHHTLARGLGSKHKIFERNISYGFRHVVFLQERHHSHQTSLVPLTEGIKHVCAFHMTYVLVRAETELWDDLNTFLSWSCSIAQGSATAHQSGVDFVKYLSLFWGHFWTHRQHQP